jgi:meiosis-specific transcription factor NDT80
MHTLTYIWLHVRRTHLPYLSAVPGLSEAALTDKQLHSTSGTGVAHAPRSTALPFPPNFGSRDPFAPSNASFRRQDPPHRHSPYSTTLRRHPLSPSSGSSLNFASPLRMDGSSGQYGQKALNNMPPLQPQTILGTLQYVDPQFRDTAVKIDIYGAVDKGFFLSDGEWTCYRRNYFSCACSYNITPYYPNAVTQCTMTASGQNQAFTVSEFAMSISAVIADSDKQTIDLVQHTPKRDKGPVNRPEKVRLPPKNASSHLMGVNLGMNLSGGSNVFGSTHDSPFGPPSQSTAAYEHNFERIQFKQATANNGKRRAAQQYYHLVFELYANAGSLGSEQWIRIAYRRTEKMIVRGRSPGHYQVERRGSAPSGPGSGSGSGPAGNMGHYSGHGVMSPDYGAAGSSSMMNHYGAFDNPGGGQYGSTRTSLPRISAQTELPPEPMLSPAEESAVRGSKPYEYYADSLYAHGGDGTSQSVDVYARSRTVSDAMMPPMTSGGGAFDLKVKGELGSSTLPSLSGWGAPSNVLQQPLDRYEGRQSSMGLYLQEVKAPTT